MKRVDGFTSFLDDVIGAWKK